jgi:ubiquinone/menaquinone biosynthesis C-methylase UbiE
MGYHEFKYYLFGLKVGVSNLLFNGFKIGTQQTIGKIFRPINYFSRFPEYHYFNICIDKWISEHQNRTLKILDVGSPKLFGLYLAYTKPVTVILTDFHKRYIEEYISLWNSIQGTAKGCIEFTTADARSLCFDNDSFDIVYAMSVIEHVEGKDGDSIALQELKRVLKQGGLLIVSIPFGDHYIEQMIETYSAYLTDGSDTSEDYSFFQRIYDMKSVKERILRSIIAHTELKLVSRRWQFILRLYLRAPLRVRAILGILNPVVSKLFNVDNEDFLSPPSNYHLHYKVYDIYSDLILFYSKGIGQK